MSDFDPQREKFLLWNYTRGDILHRWDVWSEWNITARIGKMLGGDSADKGKKPTPEYKNDRAAFNMLTKMTGESTPSGGVNGV